MLGEIFQEHMNAKGKGVVSNTAHIGSSFSRLMLKRKRKSLT